jgi:hypothetical protein
LVKAVNDIGKVAKDTVKVVKDNWKSSKKYGIGGF